MAADKCVLVQQRASHFWQKAQSACLPSERDSAREGQGSQVPVPAEHIRDTETGDFGKLFFNILYRTKIGKRLMRPVEVILYKPFT